MSTEVCDVAKAFGEALVELGEKNPKVVIVEADLADSCRSDQFKERFPERSIEVGVAEASAVAIGAGLAFSGKIPYVNTFAVFAAARAFDQVRQIVAYGRANVKICGSAAGLSLGYAGASHHALEDIALMRSQPNMLVVSPADAIETRQMVHAIAEVEGPVYLRLSRAKKPPIYDENYRLEIGKAVILKEGKDVALFATGDMVFEALKAAEMLEEQGIFAEVVNIHTIKPLDIETVSQVARKTRAVVTIEDHSVIGGLGGAIAECLGEYMPTRMRRIGLQDTFCESDSTNVLREAYGMAPHHIVEAAIDVMQTHMILAEIP
jgi:transketolase